MKLLCLVRASLKEISDRFRWGMACELIRCYQRPMHAWMMEGGALKLSHKTTKTDAQGSIFLKMIFSEFRRSKILTMPHENMLH